LNNNIRRAHRPHRENVGRMPVADRLKLIFLGPFSNSGFKTGPVKWRPNLEKWMFSKLGHPILARVTAWQARFGVWLCSAAPGSLEY
jgi:hypothetical protein